MQVTNEFARMLRENERETCFSMFLLAMETEGVPDELIERVKRHINLVYGKLDPESKVAL